MPLLMAMLPVRANIKSMEKQLALRGKQANEREASFCPLETISLPSKQNRRMAATHYGKLILLNSITIFLMDNVLFSWQFYLAAQL